MTRFVAVSACGVPRISSIELRGKETTRPIPVAKQEGNVLEVADSDLAPFMNTEVTARPILDDNTAKVEENTFWLGDQIRFDSAMPYLYPRLLQDGRGLLHVTLQARFRREVTITISIPGAGDHRYRLRPSRLKDDAFRFTLPREAMNVLGDGSPHKITISSAEAGLLTPQVTEATSRVELDTQPPSESHAQYVTVPTGWITVILSLFVLGARIFSKSAALDRASGIVEAIGHFVEPVLGGLTGFFLTTNIAQDFENTYGFVALARPLLVAFVVWVILRWTVIRLWRSIDRPLPHGGRSRSRMVRALFGITIAAIIMGGLTFCLFRSGGLPMATPIIGELKDSL
jgi:hypothetical protein